MRKMLLSFHDDVYNHVVSGEKIYEHRNVFPDEPICAYLYVSKPRQCITGRMILKNRIEVKKWIDKYYYDLDAVKRIQGYKQRYAMEITEFRETSQITLTQLRKDVPNFIIPQMYYYIDDTELLEYIEANIKETGLVIKHEFNDVSSEIICKY